MLLIINKYWDKNKAIIKLIDVLGHICPIPKELEVYRYRLQFFHHSLVFKNELKIIQTISGMLGCEPVE